MIILLIVLSVGAIPGALLGLALSKKAARWISFVMIGFAFLLIYSTLEIAQGILIIGPFATLSVGFVIGMWITVFRRERKTRRLQEKTTST